MTLSAIVGSTEYSLDDGTICRLVGHDGWGMPPLHRLTERGPNQHGQTDLGYRLDPRIGTLALLLPVTTLTEMYTRRDQLLDIFAPGNSPSLAWTMSYGTRYIDCHVDGEVAMPWEPKRWAAQLIALRLRCPDPTFYDPTAEVVTFALGGGGDSMEVPLAIPWPIGASTLDQTVSITYSGNWRSHPHRIRIVGPITDCVITNETTDEVLDFTGTTIAAADYYDIDCRYGYKTVTDAAGDNKIADLTEDSDLATWHLAPSPEAAGGVNDINVTGSSVTEATEIYLNYYTRYLGL